MSSHQSSLGLPPGVEVRPATDDEQRASLEAAAAQYGVTISAETAGGTLAPRTTLLYTVDFEPGRGWFALVLEVEWSEGDELSRTRKFLARGLQDAEAAFVELENYRRGVVIG